MRSHPGRICRPYGAIEVLSIVGCRPTGLWWIIRELRAMRLHPATRSFAPGYNVSPLRGYGGCVYRRVSSLRGYEVLSIVGGHLYGANIWSPVGATYYSRGWSVSATHGLRMCANPRVMDAQPTVYVVGACAPIRGLWMRNPRFTRLAHVRQSAG